MLELFRGQGAPKTQNNHQTKWFIQFLLVAFLVENTSWPGQAQLHVP